MWWTAAEIISLDRELLFTLANMLASEQESAVGETL